MDPVTRKRCIQCSPLRNHWYPVYASCLPSDSPDFSEYRRNSGLYPDCMAPVPVDNRLGSGRLWKPIPGREFPYLETVPAHRPHAHSGC